MWGVLLIGLLCIAVGAFAVRFRHLFRFSGPTSFGAVLDKKPTSKSEQMIVAVIGMIFILFGLYGVLSYFLGFAF
jgi:uncharacterized iron-regulated membrane protein